MRVGMRAVAPFVLDVVLRAVRVLLLRIGILERREHLLIGEELFVAGAYLGGSATERGRVVTLDVLRWLLILGMLIATANAVREPVAAALARLLGGK